MKKMLSILSAVALIPTMSSSIVACGSSKNDNDILVGPCDIKSVSASSVDENNISTVSFDVTQYINTSYTLEDIKKFSVVNDDNEYDQEKADPNNITPENKEPVVVSDINVKINDGVLTGKQGSVLTTLHVTFKAKIVNRSEHHAFEWVKFADDEKYSVIEAFVVDLPGANRK